MHLVIKWLGNRKMGRLRLSFIPSGLGVEGGEGEFTLVTAPACLVEGREGKGRLEERGKGGREARGFDSHIVEKSNDSGASLAGGGGVGWAL